MAPEERRAFLDGTVRRRFDQLLAVLDAHGDSVRGVTTALRAGSAGSAMEAPALPTPESLAAMRPAASLYYEEELSQQEVAERLDVSRSISFPAPPAGSDAGDCPH